MAQRLSRWRFPRRPQRAAALGGSLGALLAASMLARPDLAGFALGSTAALLVAGLLWDDDHPSSGRRVRVRLGRALRQPAARFLRRGAGGVAHGSHGHRSLTLDRAR